MIEQRCLTQADGASWQVAAVEALEDRGASRTRALHGMFARYLEHSAAKSRCTAGHFPAEVRRPAVRSCKGFFR